MWCPYLKFAGLDGLVDEAGLVPGVASRVIVAREKVGPPVVYGGEFWSVGPLLKDFLPNAGRIHCCCLMGRVLFRGMASRSDCWFRTVSATAGTPLGPSGN